MSDIELLSPAGSPEGLKAVIAAGADAVYIGGTRFGARAYADNPDEDELLSCIDFAHLHGVKVYLTVNTLLKENELNELYTYLLPYYLHGLDAVLVQDFGVLAFLHEKFPLLPLHISTQMTLTGPHAAKLLKSYGVTRVVPARELSLCEIKSIRDESGLEVEAFVHGALCFCYSGQCLLSSMIGGRSGNRGRCAQPCRLPYKYNDHARGYLLSPKDLCALAKLPELISSGVSCLKIEGRMKKPAYAAGVTSIYRKYLDLYLKDPSHYRVESEDQRDLLTLFNREGFTEGYLKEHNGPDMMAFHGTGEDTDAEARNILYEKEEKRFLKKEDEILMDGKASFTVGEAASLCLSSGGKTVRVTLDTVQPAKNMPLSKERIEEQLQKTHGSGFAFANLDLLCDEGIFLQMKSVNELRRKAILELKEALLSKSRRSLPDSKESGFTPEDAAGNNEYSKMPHNETADYFNDNKKHLMISASVSSAEQFHAALDESGISRIYYPISLFSDAGNLTDEALRVIGEAKRNGKEIFFALPYIERENVMSSFPEHYTELITAGLSGFLVRSLESYAVLKEMNLLACTIIDSGLYTWNSESIRFFKEAGVPMNTAPVELNKKELFSRENKDSELIVYGRLPLMITAQCMQKNTDRCTKATKFSKLTDRTGQVFLIKNECFFCYNILYNSVPLSLIDEGDLIRRMGFTYVRLAFTNESKKECEDIIKHFEQSLLYGKSIKETGGHTKGHFNRGVE